MTERCLKCGMFIGKINPFFLCDLCGEENEILLPPRVTDSTEVKDLRLCPSCFEGFMERHRKGEFPKISSLTYPHILKGNVSCVLESKYLRKVALCLEENYRELLLCLYCFKDLWLLSEKGKFSDFHPVWISGID